MSTLLKITAGTISAFVCLVMLAGIGGSDYGTKLNEGNVELYYKDSVSSEDAQKLLTLLADVFKESPNQLYFQVEGLAEKMAVRYVVLPEAWETSEFDTPFKALELLIQSQVFGEEEVVIHLCDGEFETQRVINSVEFQPDATEVASVN